MSGKLRLRVVPLAMQLLVVGNLAVSGTASALPWDRDMNRQQSFQAGEFAKAPAKGTVAVGRKPWMMSTEDAEASLKNPTPVSRDSVWRGRRLYAANCLTCHGPQGKGTGPVGPLMAVPDITTDAYRQKSDGRTYGILMNGGSNMPRYGYKFSDAERWDLINYIRFLQGREVAGIPRP